MDIQIEKKIVKIWETNLSEFTEKIAKINKRILKKGIPAFLNANFLQSKTVNISNNPAVEKLAILHVYELEFPKIALPGDWEVIGEISEGETNEKGTFNFVNGFGDLRKYTSWDLCDCQHCGIRRHRTHSIIVKSKVDQTEFVVGSSCLKDFVGHDPEAAVFLLQFLESFSGFGRDPDAETESTLYGLDGFYRATIHALKVRGWKFVSRKKSNETGEEPTAVTCLNVFFDRFAKIFPDFPNESRSELYNNLCLELNKRIETLSERIDDPELNDFEQKVAIIGSRGCVDLNVSFQYSILVAWVSRIVLEILNPDKGGESELFGTIGEKVSLTVIPTKCYVHNGQYGEVHIISGVVSGTNDKWTWFGSGVAVSSLVDDNSVVRNKEFKITATIKNHESNKYGNNTVLTRLKIAK